MEMFRSVGEAAAVCQCGVQSVGRWGSTHSRVGLLDRKSEVPDTAACSVRGRLWRAYRANAAYWGRPSCR